MKLSIAGLNNSAVHLYVADLTRVEPQDSSHCCKVSLKFSTAKRVQKRDAEDNWEAELIHSKLRARKGNDS